MIEARMNIQTRHAKGTVGVEAYQGRLRLRLPRQVFGGKQKYLSMGLADTPENRKVAELKARQIELDIISDNFDASLTKYKPQSYQAPVTQLGCLHGVSHTPDCRNNSEGAVCSGAKPYR
jgi:hypothetical protein